MFERLTRVLAELLIGLGHGISWCMLFYAPSLGSIAMLMGVFGPVDPVLQAGVIVVSVIVLHGAVQVRMTMEGEAATPGTRGG